MRDPFDAVRTPEQPAKARQLPLDHVCLGIMRLSDGWPPLPACSNPELKEQLNKFKQGAEDLHKQ